MKKNTYFLIVLFLFGVIFISCNWFEENQSGIYYKSYFLGEDSFQISGQIVAFNGKKLSADMIGKTIVAKINRLNPDWEIRSSLNDNKFNFYIKKTSDDGIVLAEGLSSSSDYKMYSTFISYFNNPSMPYKHESPQASIKIFSISFELDDGSDLYEYGFSGSQSIGGLDEYYDYVYVTEPVNISGSYKDDGDTLWQYECNFSQAGWYKLSTFFNHPIGNKRNYSANKNIILRKSYEWKF